MRKILLAVLGALCACSGSGASSSGGAVVDAGGKVSCASDPRVTAYAPGMSVHDAASDRTYVLVESQPGPPAVGTNTWKLQLYGDGGAPMSGLSLSAAAFMPDHGHPSSVTPQVTSNPDGSYSVAPLYFFMPGVWRITVSDADGGSALENGVFLLCVEG